MRQQQQASVRIRDYQIKPALIVIDVQNGFVSNGGSYNRLGINILQYQKAIPAIKKLVDTCKSVGIPVFFTESIRESSGIDLLTKTHKILPQAREERIKEMPICVRGTWDAEIIDELKPYSSDSSSTTTTTITTTSSSSSPFVITKRRDSAFYGTNLDDKLKSLGVDTVIFCGIDTSMCVESSLREAFNLGYDVIVLSDATASMNKKRYECTLDDVRSFYGIVIDTDELVKELQVARQDDG